MLISNRLVVGRTWTLRCLTVALCSMLLVAATLSAHHAFCAEFDVTKPVMLSGRVSRVESLNPHTRFYLAVKDAGGILATWELQLASPNGLIRQGWTRDSLRLGDSLVVTGYLARDGSKLVSARTIRFAD